MTNLNSGIGKDKQLRKRVCLPNCVKGQPRQVVGATDRFTPLGTRTLSRSLSLYLRRC